MVSHMPSGAGGTSWLGQYCLNVADLERAVGFYTALGLECTSRTEIPQAHEAIIERPGRGSKLQLAQQLEQELPLDLGNAFWKLYVNTDDIDVLFAKAVAAGATVESKPERMERWPVTIAFVRDLDGYLVEFVQRHPWNDSGDPGADPWLGQYCLNVSDIDATIAFYELLGLTCTSRTEIPGAREAIVENPDNGGKLQLAQHDDQGPLRMGTMWKLYVNTNDVQASHDAAVGAGRTSLVPPMRLDRWPVTIAFVSDPDGYQVEFVQRHDD